LYQNKKIETTFKSTKPAQPNYGSFNIQSFICDV
jgi:hypothetical protein